jgi:hypothetical protein
MLDVILASALAAAMLLAVALLQPAGGNALLLQQAAFDTLAVLEKDGTLAAAFAQSDAQAKQSVESALAALLPQNVGANVTLRLYEYSGDSFSLERTINAGGSGGSEAGAARRGFAVPENGDYGIATITTWYK